MGKSGNGWRRRGDLAGLRAGEVFFSAGISRGGAGMGEVRRVSKPRRGRGRRGFFVIVGWRVISTREKAEPVKCDCPECGEEGAEFVGRVRRAWFTIFFIPIIPLDPIERADRISQCRACKQTFEIPIEQMARRARGGASGGGADFSSAIELYNKLRDQPGDGKLMLRLLEIYEAMGEAGEAETAARMYPEAMQAEPRCSVVLQRIRARR